MGIDLAVTTGSAVTDCEAPRATLHPGLAPRIAPAARGHLLRVSARLRARVRAMARERDRVGVRLRLRLRLRLRFRARVHVRGRGHLAVSEEARGK